MHVSGGGARAAAHRTAIVPGRSISVHPNALAAVHLSALVVRVPGAHPTPAGVLSIFWGLLLAEASTNLAERDQPDPAASRCRSNLIAVAIDFWQWQFFEMADFNVNWVVIAIAIAFTLTALT